jgi:hypothetical protein
MAPPREPAGLLGRRGKPDARIAVITAPPAPFAAPIAASCFTGGAPPSRHALELIAGALELEPGHVAGYRLAGLRDQLDERRTGFDGAPGALPVLRDERRRALRYEHASVH